MEWRPQKEGIATKFFSKKFQNVFDGMETSKRRDCDFKSIYIFLPFILMEWRPQKEGIATLTFLNL